MLPAPPTPGQAKKPGDVPIIELTIGHPDGHPNVASALCVHRVAELDVDSSVFAIVQIPVTATQAQAVAAIEDALDIVRNQWPRLIADPAGLSIERADAKLREIGGANVG